MSKFVTMPNGEAYRKDVIVKVSKLKEGDESYYFDIFVSKEHFQYTQITIDCSSDKEIAQAQRIRTLFELN